MTTGITCYTPLVEDDVIGMPISISAILTNQTHQSLNSLEHLMDQDTKYTYSLDGAIRHEEKLKSGLVLRESDTHTLKCEGPLTVQMIICLKCGGWKTWVYSIESYSYSKIETVLLRLGEKRDILVCKCDQVISRFGAGNIGATESYPSAEPVKLARQPDKANNYQVGGAHYKSAIQHWDYVLANQIPYLEAMVIKYLTRWRKKNGHEDVKKAYHFLRKLAESEGIDLDTSPAPVGQTSAEESRNLAIQQETASRGLDGRE